MRATLIEVLGVEGETLYTQEWLRDRVRWHLQPKECDGQVFLAQDCTDHIIGQVILRVEADAPAPPLGLISTIYILPSFRRAGVARALLDAGEAWLLRRQVATLATDTSEANMPLIRLFESRGYAITFRSAEKRMVRLSRSAK
jgi:GNAT superfamily N-acetyltransferase